MTEQEKSNPCLGGSSHDIMERKVVVVARDATMKRRITTSRPTCIIVSSSYKNVINYVIHKKLHHVEKFTCLHSDDSNCQVIGGAVTFAHSTSSRLGLGRGTTEARCASRETPINVKITPMEMPIGWYMVVNFHSCNKNIEPKKGTKKASTL